MKKLKVVLLFAILLLFSHLSYSQITGSAHDFSGETWNTTGEICIVCHTPHNAMTGIADAPLWNHQLSTATFTLYATGTLDATMGQPDGSSKLCLSCHDGTVALENFGGITTGTTEITGDALIGTDLGNDHPVSFTYNTALATADGELEDPSTGLSGLGGTIDDDMLISGKMQCSSCHDVHNTGGINYMLLKSNSASALCLTCHIK